jgi:hypothetical protein
MTVGLPSLVFCYVWFRMKLTHVVAASPLLNPIDIAVVREKIMGKLALNFATTARKAVKTACTCCIEVKHKHF